jgi:hypothetical protein
MKPPKRYTTIAGSNHYANTKAVGSFIVYHDKVLSEMVNSIADWLQSQTGS